MPTPAPHGLVQLSDGGHLYYELHGPAESRTPPVVLVHGAHLDHRLWAGQVGALAARHRVLAYDVRGFGRSSLKARRYHTHRALAELLHRLDVGGPAHPVGLSLGGRITVDFAFTYRKHARSLVLAAPGLSGRRPSAGQAAACRRAIRPSLAARASLSIQEVDGENLYHRVGFRGSYHGGRQ